MDNLLFIRFFGILCTMNRREFLYYAFAWGSGLVTAGGVGAMGYRALVEKSAKRSQEEAMRLRNDTAVFRVEIEQQGTRAAIERLTRSIYFRPLETYFIEPEILMSIGEFLVPTYKVLDQLMDITRPGFGKDLSSPLVKEPVQVVKQLPN